MAAPSPEKPQAIEKQTELFKEKEVDWTKLSNIDIKFQIGKKDTDPGSFPRALKMALKTEFPDKKERESFASAIDRRAIHRGFDPHLAFDADVFRITKGALYIDMKDSSKMGIKLVPDATLEAGYEEKLPEAVKKARGAWESLKEVLKHGILTDILPAMTGDRKAGSFENRTRIWNEVMPHEGEISEYKGSYEQNREMVEFLRNNQKNKEVIAQLRSVQPSPAPSPAPVARPPRRKVEKEPPSPAPSLRRGEKEAEKALERKLYEASSLIIAIGQAKLDEKVGMVGDHVENVKRNKGDRDSIKGSIEGTFQELIRVKKTVSDLKTRLSILLPSLQNIKKENLSPQEKTKLEEKVRDLDEKQTELDFWTMDLETQEGTLKQFARQHGVKLSA